MANNTGFTENLSEMQLRNMSARYPRQNNTSRWNLPSGKSVMPNPAIPNMPFNNAQERPLVPIAPSASLPDATPSTVQSPYYTAGFLRNFIGRSMRVEFLIGTSGALVDRIGELVEVGASYIVLHPLVGNDLIMCDLYSIKFVTIFG